MSVIGTGYLNWNAEERRSDRYGFVHLCEDGAYGEAYVSPNVEDEGKAGKLKATVIATQQSTHVGDWFREVYPTTPEVGEVITLGEGTLTVEDDTEVGVKPDDGRSMDWMDIHALYRTHSQYVRLEFEPA